MKIRANKKGLVIIVVLWVVVLLTIIVASIARSGQLDTKLAIASIDSVCCKWAARSGIETAKAVLNEDARDSDSFTDFWSYNIEDFNNIQLGSSRFNVTVTDESGKLNINTATREQLLMLPNMTEQVADAILDWRDSDDEPNQSGVESGYYQNLQFGYKIQNGPFRTVRELLLLRGVSE
jgi:general secretion pathway protein K